MKQEYNKLVTAIIDSITDVIGPVALVLANQIQGIKAEPHKVIIEENRDPVIIIEKLLNKYESIIGPTALTLARKGSEPILRKNKNLKVPEKLRVCPVKYK